MIPARGTIRKSCVITGNGHKTQEGQGDEGPAQAENQKDDSFFFFGFSETFPLSFLAAEHVDIWEIQAWKRNSVLQECMLHHYQLAFICPERWIYFSVAYIFGKQWGHRR